MNTARFILLRTKCGCERFLFNDPEWPANELIRMPLRPGLPTYQGSDLHVVPPACETRDFEWRGRVVGPYRVYEEK